MTLVGEIRRPVDVSIVIPAFNEQDRIGQTLRRVSEYSSERQFSSELIMVDDGSTDAAALIVRAFQPANMVVLHRTEVNEGKGAAVKIGMLLARGTRRLVVDADLSTDIEYLDRALEAVKDSADIVVGSRHIDGSRMAVQQSVPRRVGGIGFRTFVQLLLRLPVKDSQNRIKVFTAEAAEPRFRSLRANGWAFDVEVLVYADRLGLRIQEFPIVWRDDRRSRLKVWHTARTMVDLVRVRIALRRMPGNDRGLFQMEAMSR